MSKFSVYLRELLSEQGEPIARIAKNAGLERTSIHKALKDERLLPYTALRRLSNYLQLTLPQVRELNLYYEILLQGEETYRTQETICELLSSLSQLHFSFRETEHRKELPQEIALFSGVLYGRPKIEAAITAILWEETRTEGSRLSLYLPPDAANSAPLSSLWTKGRRFLAYQLVSFLPERSGEDNRRKNLGLLKELLPLSLLSGGQHFVSYFFRQDTAFSSIDPMPYFIITPHYLIQLDSSLSVARLERSQELITLYQKRFLQILEECEPLNSYSSDLEHVLDSYMDGTGEDCYYTMMSQPCLGRYYTRERIAQHFRMEVPNRETLIQLSDQRFERLRELSGQYYTIFTEEGLRQFAADGVAVDLPPELILPVCPPVRKELLQEFRRDIQEGRVKGCMADMEKLPIPPYLTLTCDPKFGVHLYTVQGYIQGAYACNLHISESGIGQSFCSFIRSLPGSRYVYPSERTLAVLDELIQGM